MYVQTQENKATNTGLHIYRFTPYWHSKEVRISMNAPTFWIITREVFIVHHSFKYSHGPKKIRNRTVARRFRNGLNFLSYEETKESQYGVRQVRHRWVYVVCVTPYLRSCFPVKGLIYTWSCLFVCVCDQENVYLHTYYWPIVFTKWPHIAHSSTYNYYIARDGC